MQFLIRLNKQYLALMNNLYNEKDLLVKVSEGNEIAFRQLFNNYHSKLYSYI